MNNSDVVVYSVMNLALPPYINQKFKRIHLELTNRCNFSCKFCPDGVMSRPRGAIEEDLALSALKQIADLDLAEKVTFHVMGEPLLHPRFFPILDYAREVGLEVGLTTNGALLKPETIAKLAERDLYQIDISVQSPDRESFEATRGARIDFDRYREGLLDLLAACASRPSQPIFKIRLMTTRFATKMRDKLEIPNFMGNSRDLRRAVMEWTGLVYDKLGLDAESLERARSKVAKIGIYGWNVIEIHPKTFIETYVLTDWGNAFGGDDIYEADRGYCFGMQDHFAILYSGDVTLCCVDFDGRTSMGNLKDRSLLDILASPETVEAAEALRKGQLTHPYCRKCLGSGSRLGVWVKPALALAGLKLLKPLFYRTYKLYE